MADGTLIFDTKLDTKGLQTGLQGIDSKLKNIQKTSALAFGALGTGLIGAGTAGVKFNAQVEQYTATFETFTGSVDEANKTVERLQELGAKTPFEFTELAETTQLLMAYGFSADEAVNSLTMLGDASQGNAEKLNSIATGFARMKSSGKVTLEYLNLMIENGFNPLQQIAKDTGRDMGEMYDAISKGEITFDQVEGAMKKMTSKGGQYFGLMEKQSKTLNGMMSTLSDTVQMKLGEAFKVVNEKIVDLLPSIIEFIENLDIKEVIRNIKILAITLGSVYTITTALRGVIKLFNIITMIKNIGGLSVAFGNLVANISLISTTVAPVLGVVAGIGALIAVGYLLIKNWDKISQWAQKVWASIKEAWGKAGEWFNQTVVIPIKDFFSKMWNSIKDFGTNTCESIKGVWESVSTWFNDTVVSPISNLFSVIYEKFMSVVVDFQEIFRRAGVIFDELVVKPITEFSTNLFNSIKDGASALWESIVNIWINVSTWFSANVIEPVKNFFINLWNVVSNKARDGWKGVTNVWNSAKDWFSNNVTKPIKGFFNGMWESIKSSTKNAWDWILGLFTKGGRIFDGVVGSVADVFRNIVNAIIRGINAVIAIPFNKINGILNSFRNISILGVKPFDQLFGQNPLPVPKIPQLERGGILKKGQVGLLEGKGAEAVIPLERNKFWVNAVAKEFARLQPNIINNDKGQTINFYSPVTSPDEVSRRLRIDARMEMVG